jgi:hypothetical protein
LVALVSGENVHYASKDIDRELVFKISDKRNRIDRGDNPSVVPLGGGGFGELHELFRFVVVQHDLPAYECHLLFWFNFG